MSVTLILGGARSGKSIRAEKLAVESGLNVVYLATSPAMDNDTEWQDRVHHHRVRRPDSWQTVEQTIDLVEELQIYEYKSLILIDCLSLWLFNLMSSDRDVDESVANLCAMLKQFEGHVILVSNEVGMGLVPDNTLGRSFRDAQGRLNQAVAAVSNHVEFVVAGIPMTVKG
ncbi:MAG: bifunctional adenosylcobinamide kinase/adenosylcobinamide-phosphate guanylyltransferase [Mariprofundaceae bacterium]